MRSAEHINQNTEAPECEGVDARLWSSNEVQFNPNISFVRINNVRLLMFNS